MQPTIQLLALHPTQAQVRREARRFNVLACGRRFGKTDFGLDEAISGDKGLLEGYPVGWFAPNSRFYEEAWNAAVRTLGPITENKQEQKRRITLVNGAVFECWDLEDPDSGRSRKYGKVIVDEAALVGKLESSWEQAIAPTLLDFGGNAWFISSPKGFNFFKTLHDRGNNGHDKRRREWMSWSFPSAANPHLSPAEIARLGEEMPELVREQELGGKFVDLSSASVHREWMKYGERPAGMPCMIALGVDLAISLKDSAAYSAIAVLARVADGRVFVLSVRRFRLPFNGILREIERAAAQWSPVVIGIEANQFQAAVVQELVRTNEAPVRGITVQQDKLLRFQPLLSRYEQGLVYHAPGLPPEFEDELFAFPFGQFKDMCDALGLAYACCPTSSGPNVASAGPRETNKEGFGRLFVNPNGMPLTAASMFR